MDEVIKKADNLLEMFSEWQLRSSSSYNPFLQSRVEMEDLIAIQSQTEDVQVARDVGGNNNRIAYVTADKSYMRSATQAVENWADCFARPSGLFLYPPNSFCGWHTNSNNTGTRLYLSLCKEGGKSYFRYIDPITGEMHTKWEQQGWNINQFKIDKATPLWHCVYSDTLRVAIGFNIFKPTGFTLIHVGRSGGSSITTQLLNAGAEFESVHVKRAEYHKSIKYVILLRDPIERFVSAFEWVLYRQLTPTYCPELYERYTKNNPSSDELLFYGSANALAEALYDDKGNLNAQADEIIRRPGKTRSEPSQIGMSLSCYIDDDFIQQAAVGQIQIIRFEKLHEDCKCVLGITLTEECKCLNNDKTLSAKARRSLTRYLSKDLELYNKLIVITTSRIIQPVT